MNRRGFLGLFAGAAAAAQFDPERALWIPGRKLISIPAPVFVDLWPRWPDDYTIAMIAPGLYEVRPARQHSRLDLVYFHAEPISPARALKAILAQPETFPARHFPDGMMFSYPEPD